MTNRYYFAIGLLSLFFILAFLIALLFNHHHPILVLTGERSVGTWMSGALLMMAATTAMIVGIQQSFHPWFLLSAFFLLLSVDERFMIHEGMKDWIIFSLNNCSWKSQWIYELPVMAGGVAGACISILLWRYFQGSGRILLAFATLFGTISVVVDVISLGVFWEEIFKLFAELLIVCALIGKINDHHNPAKAFR